MRWPWHEIPGDDGFRWSLNMARMMCGILALLPLLFWLGAFVVMLVHGRAHEEPLIVAVLAVLALTILPAAPYVREHTAQVGIGGHLKGLLAYKLRRSVYASFATASITAFLIAQAPALFGFIATLLTRSYVPLVVGSAITYVAWALLWPSSSLWSRWAWEAELHRDALGVPPVATGGSV